MKNTRRDDLDFDFAETQSPGIDNVMPFSVYSTDCCDAFTSLSIFIGLFIKKEKPTINKININPIIKILFILYLQKINDKSIN